MTTAVYELSKDQSGQPDGKGAADVCAWMISEQCNHLKVSYPRL